MPRGLRCCDGSTYVLPNAPMIDVTPRHRMGARVYAPVVEAEVTSWAVCCDGCHRVLAVVDGSRDEVYADL